MSKLTPSLEVIIMTNEQRLSEILGKSITRQEALALITKDPEAYRQFQNFPLDYQNQVLEFLQGIRGLPILYDSFFQSIFNPSTTPERLERFLSCLMEQQIRIVRVIPREGSQLIDKGSLVIMDILVQTEDGSYINVEMQKHGYEFAGERSTCYMSDLVMRQYSQVKSEKKNKFSFKDLKPVYLIVLMEHSTKNFKEATPAYIHRVHYTCDTGAHINFLANYTYISLDTFRSVRQNIGNYLDAWFTFLSSDSPKDILKLIEAYPEFEEYYHDIALFRKKPKELMYMYSEALIQMDKNTVNYMIEEMQKEVEELSNEVREKKEILSETQNTLVETEQALAESEKALAENKKALAENKKALAENEKALAENEKALAENEKALAESEKALAENEKALAEKDAYIKQLEAKLASQNN